MLAAADPPRGLYIYIYIYIYLRIIIILMIIQIIVILNYSNNTTPVRSRAAGLSPPWTCGYYTILYYTILYYTILYVTIVCYTIRYDRILYSRYKNLSISGLASKTQNRADSEMFD